MPKSGALAVRRVRAVSGHEPEELGETAGLTGFSEPSTAGAADALIAASIVADSTRLVRALRACLRAAGPGGLAAKRVSLRNRRAEYVSGNGG